MDQHRVGAGEDVPMDSHCAEYKRSNLEANDVFLTKTMRMNIMVKMMEAWESRERSTTR